MPITNIQTAIVTGLTVAIISGIILAFVKRKWECNDKRDIRRQDAEEKMSDIQKSIWRLNKTVLIMAKIIDEQTEKVHSDLNSSLEDIATELLRESDKQ